MSFLRRAQRAHERGEVVSALTIVIEGLKRHPGTPDAVEVLLEWYAVEHPRPGLEADIVAALSPQPDADDLISTVVDNLRIGGHASIAATLLDEATKAGLAYVPPPEVDSSEESEESSDLSETELESTSSDPLESPNLESAPEGRAGDVFGEHGSGSIVESEPEEFVDRTIPETVENADTESQTASGDGVSVLPGESRQAANLVRGDSQDEALRSRGKRRWIVIGVLILAAVGIFYKGWDLVRHATANARVEAAFETFDPSDPAPLFESANAAVTEFPDDATFLELTELVRLLKDPKVTEVDTDLVPADPTSQWGLAANALAAKRQGAWEPALRDARRLTLLYPENPIGAWIFVLIYEARGELQKAAGAVSSLTNQHSSFAAGRVGQIRVAARRGDYASVESGAIALGRLGEGHPYVEVGEVDWPDVQTYFVTKLPAAAPSEPDSTIPEALLDSGAADPFLSAVKSFRSGIDALEAGDFEGARQAAEMATALDPQFAPALLFRTVMQAFEGDSRNALEAAKALASVEGLNAEFRRLAFAVIPHALAFAGRPDLAAKFVGPLPGVEPLVDVDPDSSFHTVPVDDSDEIGMYMWLARVVTQNELGDAQAAVATCVQAHQRHPGSNLFRFAAHLIAAQGGASNPLEVPDVGNSGAAAEVISAFFNGENRDVIELATSVDTESPYAAYVARLVAQAHLAVRGQAHAVKVLEERQWALIERVFLQGMKVRVWARMKGDRGRYTILRDRLRRAQPTGVNRNVDLAFAAFWQGDTKEANELLNSALEMNELHRQANWLKALVLRASARHAESRDYLRRSGRDYDGSPDVLLELGQINFELENWDEARRMFHKALLLDRDSLDALEGLGRSYAAMKSEVAIRDLTRILEQYPNSTRFDPQRSELLKWIAVVNGVREGRVEALSYLDRAESLVGKRSDILVERGTYHEARSEFDQARQRFVEALRRNSTTSTAHLGLARLAINDGARDDARDHLRRYLELEPGGAKSDWAKSALSELEESP